MFLLKLIGKKKSLDTNIFDKKNLALNKKDLTSIDKAIKIADKNKDIKMSDIKQISLKNEYITSNQLKLEI